MKAFVLALCLCLFALIPGRAPAETLGPAWAGHPVGFALVASKTRLYAAWYAADRHLTVAQRPFRGGKWRSVTLDTAVGWDSHNSIAMAVDSAGRLHVAANMHVSKLVYYLSGRSGAVTGLKRVPVLIDARRESSMTYPFFLKDAQGRLIFKYRDGGSGHGNDIYDVFDAGTARWAPLLATPLTEGEGVRNAYPAGPAAGPDGLFHLVWVWRDTPDAATNHDLSYARSRDLIHWENADGTRLDLPMRLGADDVVDPVPAHGGMINNNTLIGFDADKRPLIAYHKYDADGHTQVYVARFENGHWHTAQASEWNTYRWDFGGNGSLVFEITLQSPYQQGDEIVVPVTRLGRATNLSLNAADLSRLTETDAPSSPFAADLASIAVPAGQQINETTLTAGGHNYLLAWTTLPQNRDLPRDTIPPSSPLYLFER